MGTWYTTRETVKSALDTNGSSLSADSQVDRAIEAASRRVEKLCHRIFCPVIGTRYFDWPNDQRARPWRLWLGYDEVVSVNSLVAGGVSIPDGDYFLEPVNRGAPYRRIDINLASSSAFSAGPGTYQRAIAVDGVFGWPESLSPTPVTLSASLDDSSTTVSVDEPAFGVGDTIKVEDEYLRVVAKPFTDTGLTITADLDAKVNAQTIAVDGSLVQGEVIQLGAELLYVLSSTAASAVVLRSYAGTTLAAHNSSTAVYGVRSATVARGVNGSTAAAHSSGTQAYALTWEAPIEALTVAYAIDQLEQERSAYARTVGGNDSIRSAPGGALAKLEAAVYADYGRKPRIRGV